MHPIASIKARYRYYSLRYFENTHNGRKLKRFKGIHKGKRCFLVGNGPSLKVEDLNKIEDNGDITFGFNRIYNIFTQTNWRPTYYVSQDYKMLAGCQDIVSSLDLPVKFMPVDLEWEHGIKVKGKTAFKMHWKPKDNLSPSGFSVDLPSGIYWASTCMYSAAQIAVYMGFKEIYFIGVDHHFQISQNNKGEIVVDDNVKDYFCDQYNHDKQNLYIPNTETSTLAYLAMKQGCEENGVRVYNATRGGKLEVFERVEFDTLFDK